MESKLADGRTTEMSKALIVPGLKAPLAVPATVVASRNDPWIHFARASSLSRFWKSGLVDLGFAGQKGDQHDRWALRPALP
jgi:predicted alpha/beta hydrolase family esterase